MRSTHFNPRSREGSDDCVKQYDRHESISIHAPAKGATVTPADGWVKGLISIHAPAKGATPRSYHVTSISSDFNPRSREGSDAFVNVIALQHIPDFNPRSREGSDKKGQAENVCPFYFNPRSREGSDSDRFWYTVFLRSISIHAPAKGATRSYPWSKQQ